MTLLPAKKVSLSVVVVTLLLLVWLRIRKHHQAPVAPFSAVHARSMGYAGYVGVTTRRDDKEYGDYWKGRINEEERPRDDREYLTYSVLLRVRPPSGGEAMDDNDKDARRRWYESFVPSTPTDTGEPRLVDCYSLDVNGFLAMLTWAEAKALANKPGVVRRMSSSYLHSHLPMTQQLAALSQPSQKRSSVRSRPAL